LVVHVRIRIKGGGKEMETKAAVNTYFTADEPLLAVPLEIAEKIGLEGARMEEFEVAGGGVVPALRLKGSFEVEVVVRDRKSAKVPCVISTFKEEEAILSDQLASKLGLVILDPARGEWCFRDELGLKVRKSE
jgi:predicted aspartyl protease